MWDHPYPPAAGAAAKGVAPLLTPANECEARGFEVRPTGGRGPPPKGLHPLWTPAPDATAYPDRQQGLRCPCA